MITSLLTNLCNRTGSTIVSSDTADGARMLFHELCKKNANEGGNELASVANYVTADIDLTLAVDEDLNPYSIY